MTLFCILAIAVVATIAVGLLLLRNRELTKQIEINVKNRTSELEIQSEVAQMASRAKTDFIARLSHEMRIPLNAIAGLTYIAKQSAAQPEKVLSSLREISHATAQLTAILNDVLDLTRIESGRFELESEPFLIKDAVDDVASMIRQRCDENGLIFETSLEKISSLGVIGDKLRLNLVLMNLLGTSVGLTDKGGKISLLVDIAYETRTDIAFTFVISDNGRGMKLSESSIQFEAFEQFETSSFDRYCSSSFGLQVSQGLVRQMGGSIMTTSEVGSGTTFTFTILLTRDESVAKNETTARFDIDLSGKHILVADDSELNRTIVEEILADMNAIVEQASDGEQVVKMFKSSPFAYYDLIFMDVQMPKLSGHEATGQIRAMGRADAGSIPIIALTADAYQSDIDKAKNSGMNGHIAKPIDVDEVMRRISDNIKLS